MPNKSNASMYSHNLAHRGTAYAENHRPQTRRIALDENPTGVTAEEQIALIRPQQPEGGSVDTHHHKTFQERWGARTFAEVRERLD